ncbi:hypothetical protein BCR37DRAFT_392539 [Protomyces lactucae-debilis]|uniref:Transmembrane protein n=1 Tax=Protomyces lactucae-debilis TaxID=2754530 RepID=A0A1Y2FIW6_PROLT|nr:uncharacterized protein BCR37DRAFT_392539 [Protomyces lactucae-debilis]ORY83196.1 hypothetical protein BCR37DRAFT_392539 [Protomyces lactucae-debilis]
MSTAHYASLLSNSTQLPTLERPSPSAFPQRFAAAPYHAPSQSGHQDEQRAQSNEPPAHTGKRFSTTQHYAVAPQIALLTLLVVAPTSSLAAAFYYVLFRYLDRIGEGYLYSTISANVPLFIGTITSTIMSMLSSVIMMLFAYRLAQLWINLEKQARFADLPTADQFALMMKMCSGGSLYVIFEFLVFASPFQMHPSGYGLQRKTVTERTRPILKWTIGVFSTTMLLTLAIQVADVWVHKTLSSATLVSSSNATGPLHPYSRTLRSACFDPDSNSRSVSFNGFVDDSCVFGSNGYLFDPIETFATTTNTSSLHVIANDGAMAYLRPAITSPNISYVAQTVGVSTTCQVITGSCPRQAVSSGYARFTCPSTYAGFSGLLFSNQIFETAMLNGTRVTNPFSLGGSGCFKAYAPSFANLSTSDFVDVANFNTGIYVGLPQSCTVLACEVSVYNLQFSSKPSGTAAPPIYELLQGSAVLANQSTTHALHGAIAQSYGADQISLGVTAAAVKANSSADFAAFVALAVSQTILGQSASVFEATNSLSEQETRTIIGTKARLVPVAVFLALQILLAVFCVLIALVSTFGVDKSRGKPILHMPRMPFQAGAHAVNNARLALIDVTTLVREHFGSDAVFPPMEITRPAFDAQHEQAVASAVGRSLSQPDLGEMAMFGQLSQGYTTSMRSRVASAEHLPRNLASQEEKQVEKTVVQEASPVDNQQA